MCAISVQPDWKEREKKTVGACITHLYAKKNAHVKTNRRIMFYERLTLQRTILSQRESQTDGLPVDSRALVTQIQSDSAPLFLDE